MEPTPPTDRPAEGKILSAEEFATRFQDSARVLWTIAAGVLGDRSQAEDVLQEAAVIALSKLDRFRPDTSFVAWMGRVVRFVALNHDRRRRRRSAVDLGHVEGERASPPAPSGVELSRVGELADDQQSFDDAVCAALASLRPAARACLLLRVVQGLEYREIAAALGVPEGTAMSHVHRARRQLREMLATPAERGVAGGGGSA